MTSVTISQDSRASHTAYTVALVASVLALAALLLTPFGTLGRAFDGTATLLHLSGQTFSTGIDTGQPPLQTSAPLLAKVTAGFLALCVLGAWQRARWLWLSGLLAFLSALGTLFLLKHSLHEAILGVDALQMRAGAKRALRNYYASGGMNMGLLLSFLGSFVAIGVGSYAFAPIQLYWEKVKGILVPLVSVGLSILVGSLIILIVQPALNTSGNTFTPWQNWLSHADLIYFVYSTLFAPITHLQSLLESLKLATPLIFTGLSVAFAFRAGLFNVGASGQLTIGAILATGVGVYAPALGTLLMPLTILAAAAGGALWGAIPGILKARFGSSEVINTIMLNYIASGIFIFLIGSNSYSFFGVKKELPFKAPGDEGQSYEIQEAARFPTILQMINIGTPDQMKLSLGWLFGLISFGIIRATYKKKYASLVAGALALVISALTWQIGIEVSLESSQLNAAFLLALACVGLFSTIMWRTNLGYSLRAVGLAPKAAEYGGINVAKNTVLAMAIAGMFAGLAGTHYVQGGALDSYRLRSNMPTGVGFDGIAVALMGQSTPAGVVASSLLIGTLDTGGVDADLRLDAINRDIVTVLKALVVLFIAAGGLMNTMSSKPKALPSSSQPQPETGRSETGKPKGDIHG